MENDGLVGFALSPDGRWIAWPRHQNARKIGGVRPLLGWAVMDTTMRTVRTFTQPDAPIQRETLADLVFSGDSRYLLTSAALPDTPGTHGHSFVVWRVRDGTPTTLEEPGHYWLPNPGSAPSGVVWSRKTTIFREKVEAGNRVSYDFSQTVNSASWAPDDAAFAYIGRSVSRTEGPWRLYAGRSLAEARDRIIPLAVDPGEILGWRDTRHVVVGHYRSAV
ncbi:hypothetical protein BH09ACT10_BH09ACT10_04130 [soil metagenome]